MKPSKTLIIILTVDERKIEYILEAINNTPSANIILTELYLTNTSPEEIDK